MIAYSTGSHRSPFWSDPKIQCPMHPYFIGQFIDNLLVIHLRVGGVHSGPETVSTSASMTLAPTTSNKWILVSQTYLIESKEPSECYMMTVQLQVWPFIFTIPANSSKLQTERLKYKMTHSQLIR